MFLIYFVASHIHFAKCHTILRLRARHPKLKGEVKKICINTFFQCFQWLEINDLDVDKLEAVPIDLKKSKDAVSEKVVKTKVSIKLNTL